MPGHRSRFDEARIAQVETRRDVHQALGRGSELLGHATVGEDPERPLAVCRAQVVGAAPALVAFEAAVDRFDHHRRPVAPPTSQLVAQHVGAAEPDVAQVGGANAGGVHVQHFSDAGRLVEVDDADGAVSTPDRLHDASDMSPRRPMLLSTAARHR